MHIYLQFGQKVKVTVQMKITSFMVEAITERHHDIKIIAQKVEFISRVEESKNSRYDLN